MKRFASSCESSFVQCGSSLLKVIADFCSVVNGFCNIEPQIMHMKIFNVFKIVPTSVKKVLVSSSLLFITVFLFSF